MCVCVCVSFLSVYWDVMAYLPYLMPNKFLYNKQFYFKQFR